MEQLTANYQLPILKSYQDQSKDEVVVHFCEEEESGDDGVSWPPRRPLLQAVTEKATESATDGRNHDGYSDFARERAVGRRRARRRPPTKQNLRVREDKQMRRFGG
ncbi:hypothetical protein PIB30_045160 [Stylosanthes scabra]|uniref:Uncharacterized protein n=1 Tax=Stylosanthes scabra TaxID=79078 RepID=A0ABU6WE56_9FABA|nr:hypothetical protein [Stylosanthes scabra]